jgi:hypothetical protein
MGRIRPIANLKTEGVPVSNLTSPASSHESDAVENIVPFMPLVLPLVGAAMMFLLAFIAVFMA